MAVIAIFCQRIEADSLKDAGDILQIAVPAYAFGVTCLQKDYEGSKQFAYALGSSALTTHALKVATNEKRPNYKEGDKKRSFPSGHTAGAFLGAAFIHRRYGFKQAIIPYGFSILTGYSRVQAKKHHVHDVVAGAAISYICAWIFVSPKSSISVSSDEHMTTKIGYEKSF
ncbi:MAG: phosphatase PAP2 family protein [Puniceicoccales bacterium]|nr:phosphatase PAP2 family protein [Puniceicoccales bacterium]